MDEKTFFTTVPLVFTLLHGLLFAFSPRSKEHLSFAVVTLFFSATAYFDFEITAAGGSATPFFLAQRLSVLAMILLIAQFSYLMRGEAVPRRFWALAGGTALGAIISTFYPNAWTAVILAVLVILALETVTHPPRLRHTTGAWIVFPGLIIALVGGLADLSIDLNLVDSVFGSQSPWLYGLMALLVSVSVHLAHRMSHTELHKQLLEADNRRKTEEIEAARQLQLSMLPERLPEHPDWDLAARMITATEVGGDSYDALLEPEGTLLIAIADAVGHGTRAGTLVAAIKSLVNNGLREPTLGRDLERFDSALRRMNLGRANVALLVARLGSERLDLASAGIPPPLLWRPETGDVHELTVSGLPLGTPIPASYEDQQHVARTGYTLLFFTDGLPELVTGGGELGYDGAHRVFQAACKDGADAQEVAQRLSSAVVEMTAGAPPTDDVTFLVAQRRDS